MCVPRGHAPAAGHTTLNLRAGNLATIVQMNQVLPSGHPAAGVLDAASTSGLLLRLYEAARTCEVPDFQRTALELISTPLPLDCGWWGRATVEGKAHRVHASYLHRLPADVPERLNLDSPDNLVAQRSTEAPDRAHCFGTQDWAAHPGTAALAAHMGIHQALCIAHVDRESGLASFVSVARHAATPVFAAHEQRLLELLMPHLAAALDLCCVTNMARLRDGGNRVLLTADALGCVHVAEAGVRALLRRAWPDWTGPRLPPPGGGGDDRCARIVHRSPGACPVQVDR